MNRFVRTMRFALPILCGPAAAFAQQGFPTKPITFIVSYAAGATTDISARALAKGAEEILGVPITIENKGGAGGTVAAGLTASKKPDGYTLLIGSTSTLTVRPKVLKVSFKPEALTIMLQYSYFHNGSVVVNSNKSWKTIQEFIEYAKANPGKLNYGSTGSGSSNHLSMELLMNMTGAKLTHVPYKGSAPAVAALMAGEIDVLFDNVPNVVQQIRAGTINAIGVSGLKRTALLPDTPTVSESGVPGFEVSVWFGMQVPGATPTAIVNQVNRELANIYRQPEVTKRFNDQGVEVIASTPEEFSKLLQSEVTKWSKLIKEANIRIE